VDLSFCVCVSVCFCSLFAALWSGDRGEILRCGALSVKGGREREVVILSRGGVCTGALGRAFRWLWAAGELFVLWCWYENRVSVVVVCKEVLGCRERERERERGK
jgi:hypothetical protein